MGTDVERVDDSVPALELARRYFAPDEASHLESLPAGRRVARFYELWTRKEAYVKARGLELARGLGRSLMVDRGEWGELATFRPTPGHVLSVCAVPDPGRRLDVTIDRWEGSLAAASPCR